MLRNKKGFTLIELMIVVAIIGILAAIAIPNFLKFQAKSKQSEAKTNLKAVYTAETSYFGENNSYGTFPQVNWEPVGTSRYQFAVEAAGANPEGAAAPAFVDWSNAGLLPAGGPFTSFSAAANGNIDNDAADVGDIDIWYINDGNILVNQNNDV